MLFRSKDGDKRDVIRVFDDGDFGIGFERSGKVVFGTKVDVDFGGWDNWRFHKYHYKIPSSAN